MSFKDEVKKTADNIKDALNEAKHRSTAEKEQEERDVLGDEMTTSEKVGSVANQLKNETQANIDRAKRDVRNSG